MPMNRSKRVSSIRRNSISGASGATGNALGPKHIGGDPSGRAQTTTQPTGMANAFRARGFRGGSIRNVHRTLTEIPAGLFEEDLAGQTFNFSGYVNNAAATGAWSATGLPTGMTLDADTGVLSGTPTTIETGTATITVLGEASGSTVEFTWDFEVAAA